MDWMNPKFLHLARRPRHYNWDASPLVYAGDLLRTTDAFGVSRGYEQYFGLAESPFSLTANPRFLFESESHKAALEQIRVALRRREALTVIIGEVGTGKTMLCRTLLQELEPRTFLSIISNPLLTATDLLKQLLEDFGLVARDDARAGTLSQHEMVGALQRFMATLQPLRAHAIVLIDEAQHVRTEVLEQLRLLTNFEADDQKLLHVILVGQLDLAQVIERPELRQFRQRIARLHELQALRPHEVEQYIERRLWVAHGGLGFGHGERPAEPTVDGRFWRVRFTPQAMRAVAQLSNGLPRAINVICDRALERAYQTQIHRIDVRAVAAAARDLSLPVPSTLWLRTTPKLVAAGAAAALLLLAVGWGWRMVTTTSSVARTPAAADSAGNVSVDAEAAVPLPQADGFAVAVAAFPSAARADEVVRALRDVDLPAYVQPAQNGEHHVSVGPFASREEAVQAQAHVARVHVAESRVVSTTHDRAAESEAVATSGRTGAP